MPLTILTDKLYFPDPNTADPEGLVAIGGDLSVDRLLLAYRMGIFPWYSEEEPICWWSPDPRFVLFPSELKISSSMRTVLNKGDFKFTINRRFEEVIRNCKNALRYGEPGSWINDEIISSYLQLHEMGYAHSAEAWRDGKLVGGLYGVRLGKIFFGESMFSNESNASKFAFIHYVDLLKREGVSLIDCQVYTQHLETLGARMIVRDEFINLITS